MKLEVKEWENNTSSLENMYIYMENDSWDVRLALQLLIGTGCPMV